VWKNFPGSRNESASRRDAPLNDAKCPKRWHCTLPPTD
jgi:hypothetical protein